MTWNATQCEQVFSVLHKAANPIDYPWKTLLHTLLTLRTCVYYGSEKAIDYCIELCPVIFKLQDYNSALIKNRRGQPVGGSDYGAPVREEAKVLYQILCSDSEIRKARADARSKANGLLVPSMFWTTPFYHTQQSRSP